MRVLVTGGRDFDDVETLNMALQAVHALRGPITAIIHGDCRNKKGERCGADRHARAWAIANGIEQIAFPADWKGHGNSAGPIRNARMVKESRADRGIAFPGGAGTADCVRKMKAAKIPVWEVRHKSRVLVTAKED